MEQQHQIHTISPVYNEHSRILILGSFPSVKSREAGFFYGHPQNRFWKVLANVFQAEVPGTIEEKKAFLLEHRIAVWDVIGQCEITGSSDSSIRNVVPNPDFKNLRNHKDRTDLCEPGKRQSSYISDIFIRRQKESHLSAFYQSGKCKLEPREADRGMEDCFRLR